MHIQYNLQIPGVWKIGVAVNCNINNTVKYPYNKVPLYEEQKKTLLQTISLKKKCC